MPRPTAALLALLLPLALLTGCPAPDDGEPPDPDKDDDGDRDPEYGGFDCDDEDPAVNSEADEICDGKDNDCDGVVDEDDALDVITWYADTDDDGYGWVELTLEQCEQPSGWVRDDSDCDDTAADVNPGEDELCDNVDHDCDGDSGYYDSDDDGWATCEGDCDDEDRGINPGATEICNNIDDDCDHEIDEDDAQGATTWYQDADSDGFGDPATSDVDCHQPSGWVTDSTDCDDGDAAQYPGADEYCNGEDDDCDDEVDEDDAVDVPTWHPDEDSDGYGDPSSSEVGCEQPSGWVADDSDCDDSDAARSPAAIETCNDIDDDCDGDVDGSTAVDALTWYADSDGDSYGDAAVTLLACEQPSAYVADDTDCDDGDAAQYPGADEYCNGEDDDCDGDVDEDEAVDVVTWYDDADGDGYGDDNFTTVDCNQPSGTAPFGGDCDDGEPARSPGLPEICDFIDNDCDSQIDFDWIVPDDFSTIQGAIDGAADGDGICVMPGTYVETLVIEQDLDLGSFDRDTTVIDADGFGPVIWLSGQTDASSLRSFTITGATGADGIAITALESDATFGDLLITDNYASNASSCTGALVYLDGGDPVFEDIDVIDNSAECPAFTGMVWASGDTNPSFEHLSYLSNSVAGQGEVYGGVVFDSGSIASITNAIFGGNSVEPTSTGVNVRGTAFGCIACTLEVTNATVHANSADAGVGSVYSAAFWDGDGGTTLNNVIFSSNVASGTVILATVGFGATIIGYSDIYDQGLPRFSGMVDPTGTGTVYAYDPVFVDGTSADPESWDLSLLYTSSLIDLGDPAIYDADGSVSDIGAYGGPGSDGW